MELSRIAVRRPVAVAMFAIALALFGLLAVSRLGLDLLPQLNVPLVTITTVYPNADPQTVEEEITQPLEGGLATISGLQRLRSSSMENFSVIVAEFAWGADLGDVTNEIDARLAALAPILPADATRPVVLRLDPDQLPLMNIGLAGGADLHELTELANQSVRPALERIRGVAQVAILGGTERAIQVYYDSDALIQHGLTPLHLQQVLQYQNVVVPAGPIVNNGRRLLTKVGNRLVSAEDVGALVLGTREPTESFGLSALFPPLLRIRDVAEVREEDVTPEGFTRMGAEPAVLLQVTKRSGANSVTVSRRVQDALDALSVDVDIDLQVVSDQAKVVTDSLANLAWTGLIGALLAAGVLAYFLRDWRSILVIVVSIPFSVVITFLCMNLVGMTLNVISLGGLALAVGMLVDNAIIVLERIHRRRAEGLDAEQAAADGAAEMASAVTASTLTNIVVFLPILFTQSTAGHLFREMGVTVTLAMVASLSVSLTVVPALASRLLRHATVASRHHTVTDRLEARYSGALRWTLAKPRYVGLFLGVVLAGLVWLPTRLPLAFLPEMPGDTLYIDVILPPGTPVDRTNETASRIEAFLQSDPDVVTVATVVGEQGVSTSLTALQEMGTHKARVVAVLRPLQTGRRSTDEMIADVRAAFTDVDADLFVRSDTTAESFGDRFFPGVTVELVGPSLQTLTDLSEAVVAGLDEAGGFVQLSSTADQVHPEILFDVNDAQALQSGLTAGQVGLTLRAALTGIEATVIRDDGITIPVVLRPQPSDVANLDALDALPIPPLNQTPGDVQTPILFGRITEPVVSSGAQAIHHIGRERSVTVTAHLDGIDLTSAGRRTESLLANLDLPDGYDARLAGIHETLREAARDLGLALAAAVILVYMVMAAQFESLRHPLIIMFCVPLAGVGGLAALALTGSDLGVPAWIGLILLGGVAVNNGILLVDLANRLRRAGADVHHALISAASQRLRPILMTGLTTVLGMLPLTMATSTGTEFQRPLAIAVIGGLTLGTLMTLFVAPWAYRLLSGGHNAQRPHGTQSQPSTGRELNP